MAIKQRLREVAADVQFEWNSALFRAYWIVTGTLFLFSTSPMVAALFTGDAEIVDRVRGVMWAVLIPLVAVNLVLLVALVRTTLTRPLLPRWLARFLKRRGAFGGTTEV